MSIHTDRAIVLAASKGGMAGRIEARELWQLSKRELVELVLRLTPSGMAGDVLAAVHECETELAALRSNGVV